MTLGILLQRAETTEAIAALCAIDAEAIALAARHGASASDIKEIYIADDGTLASIDLGGDADGMPRFILNGALL